MTNTGHPPRISGPCGHRRRLSLHPLRRLGRRPRRRQASPGAGAALCRLPRWRRHRPGHHQRAAAEGRGRRPVRSIRRRSGRLRRRRHLGRSDPRSILPAGRASASTTSVPSATCRSMSASTSSSPARTTASSSPAPASSTTRARRPTTTPSASGGGRSAGCRCSASIPTAWSSAATALVWCAGALAERYAAIGGETIMVGKPHAADLRAGARRASPNSPAPGRAGHGARHRRRRRDRRSRCRPRRGSTCCSSPAASMPTCSATRTSRIRRRGRTPFSPRPASARARSCRASSGDRLDRPGAKRQVAGPSGPTSTDAGRMPSRPRHADGATPSSDLPAELAGGVVAIGNFDGVHRGHAAAARRPRSPRRARRGVPAVVLTFEPHPRTFFRPETPVFRLTPLPPEGAAPRRARRRRPRRPALRPDAFAT